MQGDRRFSQGGELQNISNQLFGENRASRPDEGDFGFQAIRSASILV
jgi:hypothetical protein